jgi:hypothetical protein
MVDSLVREEKRLPPLLSELVGERFNRAQRGQAKVDTGNWPVASLQMQFARNYVSETNRDYVTLW